MIQTFNKWDCVEIKQLGGFLTIGDVPRNWYEFEEYYNPMKEWCEENCKSKYHISIIDDKNDYLVYYVGYSFYFKSIVDAVAFKLRWG